MSDVLVCLGGAARVWEDLREAETLLGDTPFDVAACNEAGAAYAGRLTLWCSLHPEKLARMLDLRRGNQDYAVYAHAPCNALPPETIVLSERWHGSSGLYMVQCGLAHKPYRKIIVCGCPLSEEPHFFSPAPWKHAGNFGAGWIAARRDAGDVFRAMSGWTAGLTGRPNRKWLN